MDSVPKTGAAKYEIRRWCGREKTGPEEFFSKPQKNNGAAAAAALYYCSLRPRAVIVIIFLYKFLTETARLHYVYIYIYGILDRWKFHFFTLFCRADHVL